MFQILITFCSSIKVLIIVSMHFNKVGTFPLFYLTIHSLRTEILFSSLMYPKTWTLSIKKKLRDYGCFIYENRAPQKDRWFTYLKSHSKGVKNMLKVLRIVPDKSFI